MAALKRLLAETVFAGCGRLTAQGRKLDHHHSPASAPPINLGKCGVSVNALAGLPRNAPDLRLIHVFFMAEALSLAVPGRVSEVGCLQGPARPDRGNKKGTTSVLTSAGSDVPPRAGRPINGTLQINS